MGSLAEQITAAEKLSKTLQDNLAKATTDAASARKELEALGEILGELQRTSERAADGKGRLDAAAAGAGDTITEATTKIGDLTALLEGHKPGLPAELDKLPEAPLAAPPGPLPAGADPRTKLAEYDAAVNAAAGDVALKAKAVETARAEKAAALLALAAAEAFGGFARPGLDAALAELTAAVKDGTTAQTNKDYPAAAEARFRIAEISAWVGARKQAVEAAATAVEGAADTFATKEKALEDAEKALTAALALLDTERALQAKAWSAVAATIVDKAKQG